jgi:hypothetical protein
MPVLRQVAKTDNLEVQRQKINLVAQDLYDLTGGGSAVGFSRISVSDGSTSLPSITFSTEPTLGLYKVSAKTLGVVSNDSLIQYFSDTGIYNQKDFVFRKTAISSGGLTLSSSGSNYDAGTYTNISLSGGTGTEAQATIIVTPYVGSITNNGTGYTVDDLFNDIKLSGGSGSGATATIETNSSGNISSIDITTYGTGYLDSEILSLPGVQTGITTTLSTSSTQITVASTNLIQVGSTVSQTAGTGVLAANTFVSSIVSATVLELSDLPTTSGSATLSFTPPYGTGSGFSYTINDIGVVSSVTATGFGNGYSISDILTVSPTDLTQTITYLVKSEQVQIITFTGTVSLSSSGLSVGDSIEKSDNTSTTIIRKINLSGSNISSIVVDGTGFAASDTLVKTGTVSPTFTVDTATTKNQFSINTGSGYVLTPNLTLYSGNIYKFDLSDSSNVGNSFALSKFADGTFNTVNNISTTLSSSSAQITVSSTTGIIAGMAVTKVSGSGILSASTTVLSVDNATTLTLSSNPLVSGSVVLDFSGTEFTDSTLRVSNVSLTVKPNSLYPSTLYYYSLEFSDGGGVNSFDASITVDQNNPKTFGSGFAAVVTSTDSSEPIKAQIMSGNLQALSFQGSTASISSITATGTSSFNNLSATTFNTSSLNSSANLVINASGYNISNTCDTFSVGSNLSISGTSGNINSSAVIKTTGSFNSNDQLTIVGNTISSAAGYNLVLAPSGEQTAKVSGTSALTVPAGTTTERPTLTAEAGSIRYNTTTGQFEGYSGLNWSSLGGVRDIDGDTYILAETSAGANNNTLFFYTGGLESARLNSTGLNLINTGTSNISSSTIQNVSEWQSSTSYQLNSLIYSGSNVYQVTTAGTSGSVAPSHTTGVQANGTANLTWLRSVLGSINFANAQKVSFSVPAEYGADLKITNNTISSLINDIIISPLTGKKVKIASSSSLVIPAGDNSERGTSDPGGIRFNTTSNAFEGYTGSAWTSLGGIRDVDGNTYIIPELSAGSNENTLYFYNDNDNTLRVSKTELTFDSIDTITSTNNNLDINVSSITFDSLSAALSITSNTTKLSTTKTNLDFGLSSGLTNDSLVRFNASGEIYINTAFATGLYSGVKLLDKTLKVFELDDILLQTSEVTLVKGTNNFAEFIVYNPSSYHSAKITLSSLNTTVNQKHIVDYNVTNNSTDIFKVEYGKLISNSDLFDTVFDYDNSGNVRVTVTLSSNVSTGNSVLVKFIKTLIKS